jgi:hypothetical protein
MTRPLPACQECGKVVIWSEHGGGWLHAYPAGEVGPAGSRGIYPHDDPSDHQPRGEWFD